MIGTILILFLYMCARTVLICCRRRSLARRNSNHDVELLDQYENLALEYENSNANHGNRCEQIHSHGGGEADYSMILDPHINEYNIEEGKRIDQLDKDLEDE